MYARTFPNSRLCCVALLSIFAAICGCRRGPPPASIATVSSGVARMQVERHGERYSATINPNAQVQLMFKSGGIVDYIRKVPGPHGQRIIDAGDPIIAGQELARVPSTEYEAQLHQQQSQVLQADAQLQAAQAVEE